MEPQLPTLLGAFGCEWNPFLNCVNTIHKTALSLAIRGSGVEPADIQKAFDSDFQNDSQKAFDSISHPKLLQKLSGYGIHGNLIFWIGAFLTGRLQQVKVGTKLSGPCPVTSGVPQGSVVGSLLFNLFINDITDHLDPSVTSKMFADDIKIYTEL